jgi:hypothetical protein
MDTKLRYYSRLFSVLLVIIAVCLVSCKDNSRKGEVLIAEIGDKKLYLSDLSDIMQDLSGEDSIAVLTDYVNRWARTNLVLIQAENNLSPTEKNVSVELENYRASLLVHRYEQAYIAQRMDTMVSAYEIETFYKNNIDNFKLTSLLIKGLFIKVRNGFHDMDKIRKLYRSDKEKDFNDLEKLCVQGAEKFDTFDNKWIDFALLAKDLPANYENYETKIIRYKHLEEKDDYYTYFLSVKDISVKGDVAPVEHVKNDIKTIILNRRKINLIKRLETDIYNEAFRRNDIKIYIND